ncbi:MAG: ATP-binding protein [Hyphomonadaceae bacterium JAD_PAG50586_4]|nr:MAG: ATP-binding protein [Hyphomonadaceae bacterium JAD_PAG50586_4]
MRTDTNRILGAAKHLRQLVTDILDHARIDSGRIALNVEAMPVEGMLEEIAEISEPLATAQNTVLSITDPGKGLDVLADDVRVRQILINLVGNAIKFTENGDIELSAQINRSGDAVELSVHDTGIGIAPEELARLFQPFVQANAEIQKKYGGTGLGLSISQKLARAMGGAISATSTPGKGSTFTLTLPLALPRNAKPRKETATRCRAAGALTPSLGESLFGCDLRRGQILFRRQRPLELRPIDQHVAGEVFVLQRTERFVLLAHLVGEQADALQIRHDAFE